MKELAVLVAIAAIGITVFLALNERKKQQEQQRLEQLAQTIVPPSPKKQTVTPFLSFSGRILKHGSDGTLHVDCDRPTGGLPPGYELQDVTGEFLLTGHPDAEKLPDEHRMEFEAHHDGTHTYTTPQGTVKTIRKIEFVRAHETTPIIPASNLPRVDGSR